MADRIIRQYYRQARFSRGTAAQWTEENPVLYKGEPGYEDDTRAMKVGDGVTHWVDLPYVVGTQGISGLQGPAGPRGLPGDQGDEGEWYPVPGAQGAPGAEGPQGATGPQGPAIGLVAEDGEDAPIFIARGQDGQAGATGSQGAQGLQGPTGAPGEPGEDAELLLVPGPQGTPGATGAAGTPGAQGPAGVPGFDGDDAENLIIVGPTGASGATGAEGATGPAGPQGPAVGLVLEDGEDAPLFIARGQDGQAGAQGDAGTQGPQGPPGLPGLDGEDAELILVPGPQGPQGATGDTGAPGSGGGGAAGPPGMDGEDGDWLPLPGQGESLIIRGRPKNATVTYHCLPGVAITGFSASGVPPAAANTDHYQPFLLDRTMEFDSVDLRLTDDPVDGNNLRVGIYAADINWQPEGNPLADSGDISTDLIGVKSYDFGGSPLALPAGRYLLVFNITTASSVAFATWDGNVPGASALDIASGGWNRLWTVARTYAAFPSPGTHWTATGNSATNPTMRYYSILRSSSP